eukprot:4875408-Prymnesium_polylepis.1
MQSSGQTVAEQYMTGVQVASASQSPVRKAVARVSEVWKPLKCASRVVYSSAALGSSRRHVPNWPCSGQEKGDPLCSLILAGVTIEAQVSLEIAARCSRVDIELRRRSI